MLCEMCGKETGIIKKIDVEGSILSVCSNCSRFGKAYQTEPGSVRSSQVSKSEATSASSVEDRLAQRQKRMQSRDIFSESSSRELVEDYHRVIQQARMAMGLNQEELARKLNERKSIITKLETKSIKPDNKLIRKLEKTLKIDLMENI